MSRQKCFYFTKLIVTIVLLVIVDEGLGLKCYQCESDKNGACVGDLKEDLIQECKMPATTEAPKTTKEPTTPDSSTPSSTEESSTPSSTTEESSTPSSPSTEESTTEEITTEETTTEESSTPSSTTEESSSPSSSTEQSTTEEITTAESTPEGSTTEELTTEEATTEGAITGRSSGARAARLSPKFSLRANNEFVCYVYEYKDNDKEKTKRGCELKENFKCDGRDNCKTCEDDECNSASSVKLGIMSIFLPIVFTVITFLHR